MISSHAIVQSDDIGENTIIMEFAVIRKGVRLGKNVIVHPFVVIEPGVVIGDNVEIFPGSYIGKIPKGAVVARKPEYREYVNVGDNCSIGPHANIFYDVEIGANTLLGDGASVREKCRIGSNCLLSRHVTVNYASQIGDNTKILDSTHITGNCKIGNNVFISTLVATTNDNAIGKLGYDEERIIGPTVEDGAAIGSGAQLLPGIQIGHDAIVGAGAVVTKDVPAKAVVMGNPAQIRRFVQ